MGNSVDTLDHRMEAVPTLVRGEESETLDRNEIFELLSNPRRRYTIHFCKGQSEPVTIGYLAEQIAAVEQDKEIVELTSAERKTVYTSLQQTHLPRLKRANMIHYDERTIELTDQAKELEVYLDIVPAGGVSWGMYYLGLSGIALVVLGGVWVGFVPTDTIPELGWAWIILMLFMISAIVHVLHSHRYQLGDFEGMP